MLNSTVFVCNLLMYMHVVFMNTTGNGSTVVAMGPASLCHKPKGSVEFIHSPLSWAAMHGTLRYKPVSKGTEVLLLMVTLTCDSQHHFVY